MIGQCHSISIIVNQRVYRSEDSVCVVAVVCTLCNCEGVSISEDINGDYSSAEHCLMLWHDYKNKWCQVYDSSVSVSCNRQLVTQWSFVQHCSLHYSILDNDWDYNTSIRDDYSDNHYYILLCLLLQPFWEPHQWWGVCCSFKMLAGVQRASNTSVSMKWSICDNMAATVCCVWYPDVDSQETAPYRSPFNTYGLHNGKA